MTLVEALTLGVVQGLTEFLPISSSGHLLIVPRALGWDDPGAAFTAIIQLGTMAAVLAFFRRDIAAVSAGWWRGLRDAGARNTPEYRTGWAVALGTVPICIAGFAFRHQIETSARNLGLVAAMLIVLGVILEIADRFGPERRTMDDVRVRDGWIVGAAQALALIPGVSRSGSTITAARFLGMQRKDAARFSFLLSIPAVVLSGLFELRKLGEANAPELVPTLVATLAAFTSGYASIALLLRFLTTHRMTVFVAYRLVLGVGVIVWLSAS